MGADDLLTWYVVRAEERRERHAATNLEVRGFAAYVPTLLTRRKRLGRWIDAAEAIFPGYAFLGARSRLDGGRKMVVQNLDRARLTRGVLGFVRFGTVFAIMPDSAILELRKREAAGREGMIEDPARKFAAGETVQIIAGQFAGLQGIYSERDGAHRARILLGYLDQVRRLSLPADWIAKL